MCPIYLCFKNSRIRPPYFPADYVFRVNQRVVNCLAHGFPSLLSEVQEKVRCKLVSEVQPKFAPALMVFEITDCCVNNTILKIV